jgi:hypothetical protein
MTSNRETKELENPRYRIAFAECNHTMDVDLEYAIKQAKRIAGEIFFTCKDCAEHKRGFCDKTPLKRAAYITRLPRPFPPSSSRKSSSQPPPHNPLLSRKLVESYQA